MPRRFLLFILCVNSFLKIRIKTVRSTIKKYFKYLNTRNVSFPMKISNINIFETNNNLIINVFGYEDNEVYPLHISSKTSRHTEIDILYYQSHYFLITNFNRLMNYKKGIHHFCKRC